MEGLRIGICLDVKKKPFQIVEIGKSLGTSHFCGRPPLFIPIIIHPT
jgi:hypothetical protein